MEESDFIGRFGLTSRVQKVYCLLVSIQQTNNCSDISITSGTYHLLAIFSIEQSISNHKCRTCSLKEKAWLWYTNDRFTRLSKINFIVYFQGPSNSTSSNSSSKQDLFKYNYQFSYVNATIDFDLVFTKRFEGTRFNPFHGTGFFLYYLETSVN